MRLKKQNRGPPCDINNDGVVESSAPFVPCENLLQVGMIVDLTGTGREKNLMSYHTGIALVYLQHEPRSLN